MAYALRLPKDVTDLIISMRDWRYELVRAGGKTPSAQCMPESIEHLLWATPRSLARSGRPVTDTLAPGKFYMQRLDFCRYSGDVKTPGAIINIWKGVEYCPRSRCDVGHGDVVHTFGDVCAANRLFG